MGGDDDAPPSIDTSQIKTWRSIVTLIVFVLTSTSPPSLPLWHAADPNLTA
jgi:hypothetical protein